MNKHLLELYYKNRANDFAPFTHNSSVITESANPDLIARFDYIHFFAPSLPPELAGLDLTDQDQVSDTALLQYLGNNADNPIPPCAADLNNDGVVDGIDLVGFANDFGETNCPAADD